MTVAWAAGVALALRSDPSPPGLGLLALAAVLTFFLRVGVRRTTVPAAALLLALLGVLRVELFEATPGRGLESYAGERSVRVEGLVVGDPETSGTMTRFRLEAQRVAKDGTWSDVSEDLQVALGPSPQLMPTLGNRFVRYGDLLLLEGSLEAPASPRPGRGR